MQDKMKIGIIGCGNICRAYFGGAQKTDALEVKSCADIRMEAARSANANWASASGKKMTPAMAGTVATHLVTGLLLIGGYVAAGALR